MWFLSARKAQLALRSRRRSSPYRPRLEALEDRCLLNAGALDTTFGSGAGYVTAAVGTTNASASQVLVQPSGNIVVAGNSTISVTGKGHTTYNTTVFTAATYKLDGTLDTAFGSSGIVQQAFAGQSTAKLYGAALEPTGGTGDDKIVLGGAVSAPGGLALLRLNANGSLDTTFGSSGQVITLFNKNDTFELARGVVVTSSGQIVAVGDNGAQNWLLARYNSDGSLDSTFGTSGKTTTLISSTSKGVQVRAISQQPDGKLVVVGDESLGNGIYQGIVVRYNADGSLDTAFGNGGIVTINLGTGIYSNHYGVAVYPNAGTANDGKIVVAGRAYSGSSVSTYTYQPLVERYNTDGSLDTSFGNGAGYVTIGTAVHAGFLADVAMIESDGKPVLVGTDSGSALVARLNADGSLDSTFGTGGLVTTSIGTSGQFFGMAFQTDGKIVAAGLATVGSKNDFALARYLPSEPEIGAFTASPNPVAAGSTVTLTVSGITDGNANSTITQVALYYFDSTGTKQVLGYGTQTSPGVWTLNYTVSLASGTYTIYAQAEDSYGVFGDPFAVSLTVQ
jgi:uncharacterized delta-60 repeat protein